MKLRKSFGLAGVVAVVVFLGLLIPANAHAYDRHRVKWPTLSQGEFDAYCKGRGYHGADTVDPKNAHSIRCKTADGQLVSIDVTDLCNKAFGQKAAHVFGKRVNFVARLLDMGKTWGAWQCIPNFGLAGAPNIGKWCSSRGMELFYWDGASFAAYGWFCRAPDGSRFEGIPMDQVCKQTFGPRALDRVIDVNNKATWECTYVYPKKRLHRR